MNKTIILVATGVVAAGAGFAAGYFVGRNYMKKQTDGIINAMNDEINDYVRQITTMQIGSKVNGNDPSSYVMTPEQEEAVKRAKALSKKNDELKAEYMNRIKSNGYKTFSMSDEERAKIKAELDGMTDEEKLDFVTRDEDDEERIAENEARNLESDEDYEERMAETEDVVAAEALESGLPPYIIDEQEYMSSQFDAFTKQQFTYFSDGTLIDDGDDIVPNADDVVGLDNLIELEDNSTDRIFVRNEGYAADYEIIYKEMSYNEYMGAQ